MLLPQITKLRAPQPASRVSLSFSYYHQPQPHFFSDFLVATFSFLQFPPCFDNSCCNSDLHCYPVDRVLEPLLLGILCPSIASDTGQRRSHSPYQSDQACSCEQLHFTRSSSLQSVSFNVGVMSSRFKSLGFGSKRKSAANIQNSSTTSTLVASPNGSTSTAGTPPPPQNTSTTSLPPMNPNQPAAPGRPPSYSYNTVAGRPQSPMPPAQNQMAHHPAPIDTRAGAYVGGAPQLGPPQPPGYGGAYGHQQQQQLGPQPGIQHMANQYPPGARPAAEVEGAGRSKAQLIVGIDFVRNRTNPQNDISRLNTDHIVSGHHILWRSLCLCDQHRSERGYHHRMAWSRQPDKAKGGLPTVHLID